MKPKKQHLKKRKDGRYVREKEKIYLSSQIGSH